MRVHQLLFVTPAAVALIGAATAAIAGDAAVRVAVGDLNQPAAARDFHHRLSLAAARFCVDRYRPVELAALAACRAAVREEAVAELSADQQQALADALAPAPKLASR
jgi:UrcA family protein